ncbi:uncharacterized protein LOC111692984 [Anoplophora glabripennis]|uniref:uncharacterized protein LOC111692872 n=1 Tax=Anoplophora glabripennis TaxID=217634 RepID=UPI000C7726B9|nr:uncharacterized protein LOC111692872 [Anoplophora glabripennis]XP_023312892.1 uncharacterized protein LOC111692984 [Anoplophora glabripennis]
MDILTSKRVRQKRLAITLTIKFCSEGRWKKSVRTIYKIGHKKDEMVNPIMDFLRVCMKWRGELENNAKHEKNVQVEGRKKGAFVIKTGQRQYAGLLKEIKEGIKDKAPSELETLKKTRKGDILLTNGGAAGARKVKETMNQVTGAEIVIVGVGTRKMLNVYDMDETADKVEIENAIGQELELSEKVDIKVLSLRPTARGNQNATVALPGDYEDKLIRRGWLRIGWTRCKVRQRLEVAKCYNCCEMGHMARDCKGPNRKNTCMRCGETGHRVRECTGEKEE